MNETDLRAIRDKINSLVDQLLLGLSQEKGGVPPDCAKDVGKASEGSLLLKEKIVEFLKDGTISEKVTNDSSSSYLSKVRHDLRNCINVINGYLEMAIEELQDRSMNAEVDRLLALSALVKQILQLIDGIKNPASPTLPDHPPSFKIQTQPIGLKSAESTEFQSFKEKFSVLIVDDNRESCEILQRYLHRIRYENKHLAYDGYQALSFIGKQPVDLVLLDIDMPKMSGIEVLERLNEDIAKQRLMVLMISAIDNMESTIACIQLGAVDFLPKPFNADLLRVRIGSCTEKKWFINQEKLYRERLEFEEQHYENLMRAVFPSIIIDELATTGVVQPAQYNDVSIIFADVVSFTAYCDTHPPSEILENLQSFVEMCESTALEYHVQKIKTIGDCFLGTSGKIIKRENPVLDCLGCAKKLLSLSALLPSKWQLRIGIHFGSLIGGIVGHRQYQFDVWGDAVNTAARIQSQAAPGTICLSKQAWEKVQDQCTGRSLGLRPVRGKAPLEIFEYGSGG